MENQLLRDVRPDIFNMVKNQNIYKNIGVKSGKSIEFICPRCGSTVIQIVHNVTTRGLSCKMCGDGISFGEKFIFNLLDQLGVSFETHVTFPWSDRRIYDVCVHDNINNSLYLLEIHGAQHYNGGFESIGGRTYQEELNNDAYKKHLAMQNGFCEDTYIVVDCRESTTEYIKNNIYNNTFFSQYNLDDVDWTLCTLNATSSYAIKAQQLWNDGYKMCDICSKLKLSSATIRKYLKIGTQNGVCYYTPEEAHRRSWKKGGATRCTKNNSKSNGYKKKKVFCPELQLYFESIVEASVKTGVSETQINYIVSGKRKIAKKNKYGFPLTFLAASAVDTFLYQ